MQTREDILERAAEAARVVVHMEIAYDIIDELASSPDKYSESLYKLSRLAAKVYNDLLKAAEREKTQPEAAKTLDIAIRRVGSWADIVEELFKYLGGLDEKKKREEVKRFAALAISPDRHIYALMEALKQKESKREGG